MSAYQLGDDGAEHISFHDRAAGERLDIPASEFAGLLQPAQVAPVPTPAAIRQALDRPVGSLPLRILARGAQAVAIAVSDSTRSVPTSAILEEVMRDLEVAGVTPERVKVVVATGVHRGATAQEMATFLGPRWSGRITIENHRPCDLGHLVPMGHTRRGTEVLLNRTVAEADLRIAFGQVEPHEFAGFTGGPKSVLPGVSGEPTIRKNHAPDMLLDPSSRPGVLTGNPIWEDMLEAARLAHLDFVVNVVLTPAGEIAAVAAGDVYDAHRTATSRYGELYGVHELDRPADVVVTTPGRPLDLNLYQSVKAIIAAECAVRDGGVVVLYAGCREGTGGDLFVAPYRGAKAPGEVIANACARYRIEMDHALLLSRLQRDRGLRFVVVAPGVEAAILEAMSFVPAPSLQEAYDTATRLAMEGQAGGNVRTLVFPQPQKQVCRCSRNVGA